jgi:hypothetical protein
MLQKLNPFYGWLATIWLCLALPLSAGTFGNFIYTDNGTSISITGLSAAGQIASVVSIPSIITGKPVTTIAGSAFRDSSNLTSVTIPSSVTSIGIQAFYNCTSLSSISIPSGVATLGSGAFQNCSALTTASIPSSVTSIGTWAFRDCAALASITVDGANANYSSVNGVLFNKPKTTLIQYPPSKIGAYVVPSSVTTIGDYAFSLCSGLSGVTIPSGVVALGEGAFRDCSGLTSITFPATTISIGNGALLGCSGLTSINVDPANSVYSSADGVLFIMLAPPRLIQYPAAKVGAYFVPPGIQIIGSQAFLNCTGLSSVSIPSSITSIAIGAFMGCTGLTSVTIPPDALSINIGGAAFSGCSGLTSVTIPSSVTVMGNLAFEYCTGLKNVTFEPGLSSIPQWAFYGCSGLTTASISSSVTTIADQAFYNCTAFTGIYFQGNAPSLGGSGVFTGDTNLTVYYVPNTTGWSSTYGGRPTKALSVALNSFHINNGLSPDGSQDFLTPAGDGVPNLYKYAFNMIGGGTGQATTLSVPNNQSVGVSGTAGLPFTEYQVGGSTKFRWTYIRRKASTLPGITYFVEFSDDLVSGTWAANPLAIESVTSINATFERVTLTDSVSNASRRFSRVRINVP